MLVYRRCYRLGAVCATILCGYAMGSGSEICMTGSDGALPVVAVTWTVVLPRPCNPPPPGHAGTCQGRVRKEQREGQAARWGRGGEPTAPRQGMLERPMGTGRDSQGTVGSLARSMVHRILEDTWGGNLGPRRTGEPKKEDPALLVDSTRSAQSQQLQGRALVQPMVGVHPNGEASPLQRQRQR